MSAIEILKKYKEINTDELDISELVDIRDVKIDSKKPYLIRMISYINKLNIHIVIAWEMYELGFLMPEKKKH